MTQFFNRKQEKEKRRALRKVMPRAEVVLWTKLRGQQIQGCKFRRQYSVGPFIIDFYCPRLKLAVEIDGDSHFQPGAELYDRERQAYLESFGIRVVRFTNSEVFKNLKGVLMAIEQTVEERRRG